MDSLGGNHSDTDLVGGRVGEGRVVGKEEKGVGWRSRVWGRKSGWSWVAWE